MKQVKIGYPLIRLQSVDSTNSYAVQLLRNNKPTEGTVILSEYQSAGKGQAGNRWISDAGCNLLFSFILIPGFLPAEKQFYLCMCVSNAILDYIQPISKNVKIKWPNDILLGGKKVAGILIENTVLGRNLDSSVVGIGLNVNQKDFPPDIQSPTSLQIATGKDYDLSESLHILLESLNNHINTLYNELFAEIKTMYLNNLWGLHEWARYTDKNGTFEGRIVDVADSGELIVLQRNGTIEQYGFKEIVFSAI